MKLHLSLPVICCLTGLFFVRPETAHARYRPGIVWRTVRTGQFTIYYPRGHEQFAREVLARTDAVHDGITGLFGIEPPHCPVVLHPDTDLFNGSFLPLPNRISLYETPYHSLRGFGPVSDMLDQVFVHEYAHFAHLTARAGWYGSVTQVIGDGLALSNGYAPGWLVEGVATWAETELTDGGRGRDTLFKGQFGSFSGAPGFWGISALSSPSPYHPPPDRIYSAGWFLTDYLVSTSGPEAPGQLMREQARHPLGGVGRALHEVTGLTPERFYRDFREDINARFIVMRDSAAAAGLPMPRILLDGPYDRYHQFIWADASTILALRTGYEHDTALITVDARTGAILGEQETGRLDLLGGIRRSPDGRLIHARYYLHPLGGGDITVTDLATYDPSTGARERITHGEHIFGASLSPDGSHYAAAQRNGIGNDLVLVDARDGAVTPLVSQPGVLWESPVWSPDGSVIAAVRKSGQHADIVLVDPADGSVSLLFESDVAEDNEPSFSPDNRWIAFSSNRTGTWDVFAWDRRGRRLFRLTAEPWVAGSPKVSPDGTLLAFTSIERGMERLCVLPFEPDRGVVIPVADAGMPPMPDSDIRALPALPESRGIPLWEAYRPFIHAPWVSRDEDGAMLGILIAGADPVGITSYGATLLYGIRSSRPGYEITVTNRSFWPELSLRLYDRTDEGNTVGGGPDVWYRERGGELSASLPIIHRTAPDVLQSTVQAGIRFRSYEGVDGLLIDPSSDRSRSVFGGLAVSRTPSHAPRDMVPAWGQALTVVHEEAFSSFGGELPGRNTVLEVTQHVPSPIAHHGFTARAILQRQGGRLSYNREASIPRGYSSSDEGFQYRKTVRLSLDYQFPLWYPDTGIGLNAAHLYLLKGALFADTGAGWRDRFDTGAWRDRARTVVGGMLSAQGTVMTWLPLETGIIAGYRLSDETPFAEMMLQVQL